MTNRMLRGSLVAAASALVAIIIATVGAFVIPMPNSDPVDFLYHVMLLIGMPVGTVVTLALRETPGVGGLWNHVGMAAMFGVLNWTLIGILYGLLRQWTTKRKVRPDAR